MYPAARSLCDSWASCSYCFRANPAIRVTLEVMWSGVRTVRPTKLASHNVHRDN